MNYLGCSINQLCNTINVKLNLFEKEINSIKTNILYLENKTTNNYIKLEDKLNKINENLKILNNKNNIKNYEEEIFEMPSEMLNAYG